MVVRRREIVNYLRPTPIYSQTTKEGCRTHAFFYFIFSVNVHFSRGSKNLNANPQDVGSTLLGRPVVRGKRPP